MDATRLRTTRVVLAAAHLDSNPANNRLANLRAFCQRCHMLHDRPHHLAQRWIIYRRRYALGDLFLGRYEPALMELAWDEKRHMRRLYPDVAFDWKKITQQLAEKREDCRRYRTRSRKATRRSSLYDDDPVFGVYEPSARTIYTSGIPSSATGMGRLLDAVLQFDREQATVPLPSQPVPRPAKPALTLVHDRKPAKP